MTERYLPGVQRLEPDSNGDPRWRWGCWEITIIRVEHAGRTAWRFWMAHDTETPGMPSYVIESRTRVTFNGRHLLDTLFDLGPDPLTAAEVAELAVAR